MKNLKYAFFAVIAMTFAACDTNDDAFYNETYVESPNLVHIGAQPSFVAGDYLYVDADFSRYISETGQSTPLDIYTSTNGAQQFNFTYVIEKQVGTDEWQPLEIGGNSNLNVISGAAEISSFVYAHAIFNPIDATYEYNVGIPLQSAGNYRLSFGLNSSDTDVVELRSETLGNNLFLNIASTVENLDPQGYYLFTVI